MNVNEILETVESGENEFQAKCKKFSGTLTVETIRNALKEKGIFTSPRDVFIEGLCQKFKWDYAIEALFNDGILKTESIGEYICLEYKRKKI